MGVSPVCSAPLLSAHQRHHQNTTARSADIIYMRAATIDANQRSLTERYAAYRGNIPDRQSSANPHRRCSHSPGVRVVVAVRSTALRAVLLTSLCARLLRHA
jgi:hypothetical protein